MKLQLIPVKRPGLNVLHILLLLALLTPSICLSAEEDFESAVTKDNVLSELTPRVEQSSRTTSNSTGPACKCPLAKEGRTVESECELCLDKDNCPNFGCIFPAGGGAGSEFALCEWVSPDRCNCSGVDASAVTGIPAGSTNVAVDCPVSESPNCGGIDCKVYYTRPNGHRGESAICTNAAGQIVACVGGSDAAPGVKCKAT